MRAHYPTIAAILCAASFGMGISLLIPALTLKMEAMGYSGALIGWHAAFGALASISIAPLTPWLVQRFGFAFILRLSLVISAIAVLMIAFTDSPLLWLLPRFLFSLSVTAIFAMSESWINTITPPGRRGVIIGIYASVLSIGFAAGPAILSFMGVNNPWLIPATMLLLLPAAYAALIAPHSIGAMHTLSVRSLLKFFNRLPIPLAAALVFGLFETSAFTFLPLWGMQNGHSVENSTLLITLLNLGIVAWQIPLGTLADRFSKPYIIAISVSGLIGLTVALIFLASGLSLYTLYAIIFIWGGLASALYTVGLTWLMDEVDRKTIVEANSYFVWMYTIGMLIAPQIVGLAHDASPGKGLMICISGFLCAYLIALTQNLRHRA